MKRLVYVSISLVMAATPVFADTAEDLDKWFRDGYAALYVENAWDHADEFAQYFADEIADRSDDGLAMTDVNDFVIDSLDGWRDEGWLGTDIVALETTLLNAATVVFDIKWSDRYDDGSTEISCGWYFADKADGEWLLSQWIAMECKD